MHDTGKLVDHQELERFEEAVNAFLEGRLDADRFTAVRLQHGVYGQRQDGVYMVRVKLPGGRLSPLQLQGIADALERHSRHDAAHISTRQDIQIHHVPIANAPVVLRELAAHGLTTREACGNTVRNLTACPLAGVCPREHTDVRKVLDGAVRRFLRHPLTQHLPRKFKMSFSGCEADCAQGMIHDVGVIATRQQGRYGYRVLAGGGLGAKPHEAIVLEPFIEEQDLLPVIEAVISLHHRYSDRKRRARARVKFLVDRFGPEGFREKYREERARGQAIVAQPYPRAEWREADEAEICGAGAPRQALPQHRRGRFVVPVHVPIGDITAPQLRGIAALMRTHGLHDVRTTQDQNLMVLGVPGERLGLLCAGLEALRLAMPQAGDNVVACPGTSTCRLGITSSKFLARRLHGGPTDLRVHVSGCHNSCAQPDTADIGLYGEGRRLFGRLVPHYVLQVGGKGLAGGGLAIDGPEVPAARAPEAVARVAEDYERTREAGESFFEWARTRGAGHFHRLLADLTRVEEAELPQVLRDLGEVSAFKVLPLGGGECAGLKQETVAANFAEAAYERDCRNAFARERRYAEAAECLGAIARLVSRSALFVVGMKSGAPEALQAAAEAMRASLPKRLGLADDLGCIAAQLEGFTADPKEETYTALAERLDCWTLTVAETCEHLDPGLDLSEWVPGIARQPEVALPTAAAR
jgi:sulfite reductase (ferredoxin)